MRIATRLTLTAMDMYSKANRSVPQKTFILGSAVGLTVISFLILFPGGSIFEGSTAGGIDAIGRLLIFSFNAVVCLRFVFTLFVFLKRKIPFEETLSVPFAFALYFVGFSLLAVNGGKAVAALFVAGSIFFVAGGFINTWSEYKRHIWKKEATNQGKLYTGGLFRHSRHVNYFGDLLWVLGYAMVTGNPVSFIVPLILFAFFYFFNIPVLEKHLKQKYPDEFPQYERKVKKLIPYLF